MYMSQSYSIRQKLKPRNEQGELVRLTSKRTRPGLIHLGRVLEALTSLTGQPLQRLKEDVTSKDNEAEKWRTLVEHQCWILLATIPRMYANDTSDRLKESAEIGKKAEDILLDVSKVVKELEAVQTAVLSRRPSHLGQC